MNKPIDIDDVQMISNSGGRTSAMLTEELLRDEEFRKRAVVCFANTGLEDEETLIFVHKCSQRWRDLYGIEVVWLEYDRDETGKPIFNIVSFETASRKGEPFAALLEGRNNLPNLVARYCTAELKVRTIKRYMMSIGCEHWTNVLGIRYDEPRRWAKSKAVAERERWEVDMPMVRWKTTKPDVLAYWENMPFNLMIEDDSFGNCDLCFLKGMGKKKMILRKRPQVAEFWKYWEERRAGYSFSSRYKVANLLEQVQNSPELFDTIEEPDIDCFCNID